MEAITRKTLLALERTAGSTTVKHALFGIPVYVRIKAVNTGLLSRDDSGLNIVYKHTPKGAAMHKVAQTIQTMTARSEPAAQKMIELYTEKYGYSAELNELWHERKIPKYPFTDPTNYDYTNRQCRCTLD